MPEWGKWLIKIGWRVERVGLIKRGSFPAYIRKIPLIPFSIIKIQRFNEQLEAKEIEQLKKKYRAIYVALEPTGEELVGEWLRQGYRVEKSPFLPSKTLVIDLTKPKQKLWEELSDNARRIIKKSEVKSEKTNEEEFYAGWKRWSPVVTLSKGQFEAMVKVFGKKITFWASRKAEEILSAVMLIESDERAHYFQTWTSKQGRKIGAHYLLVWRTILWAKKKGKKYFDFEGVYDKRFPMKRWRGFSEFKKKFGGKIVSYPGCVSRWF